MADCFEVRAIVPGDLPAIEMLYPDAFPNEDLLPLVIALLQDAAETLSLVGTVGETIVGIVTLSAISLLSAIEQQAKSMKSHT